MDRITIAVEDDIGVAVRKAAAEQGQSVSAWMAEAAAARLRNHFLGQFLDEYEAEYGAFTEEEMAEARALFRRKPGRWKDEPTP
ncbi:hypothetical protein [Nocardioides humi]|uniref:Ribbon-helix-helix protein, copG family n=1 Tax=Nocardioides humi TaxID=449461 RepID=A0ABN2AKG3_9ACTN|nr:hypothetical protein [Nocardioides humi]